MIFFDFYQIWVGGASYKRTNVIGGPTTFFLKNGFCRRTFINNEKFSTKKISLILICSIYCWFFQLGGRGGSGYHEGINIIRETGGSFFLKREFFWKILPKNEKFCTDINFSYFSIFPKLRGRGDWRARWRFFQRGSCSVEEFQNENLTFSKKNSLILI